MNLELSAIFWKTSVWLFFLYCSSAVFSFPSDFNHAKQSTKSKYSFQLFVKLVIDDPPNEHDDPIIKIQ